MINNQEYILEFKDVIKNYKISNSSNKTVALDKTNLKIKNGEILIILGPSGSGKSTLLNLLTGLDNPSSGKIFFNNKDITNYNTVELQEFRREEIGFIFQTYNLIPNLKVKENIELGLRLNKNADIKEIDELLEFFEMNDQKNKYPFQLSGGQQQRVAIARALAKKPNILACDEPTGALDEVNSIKVLSKLQESNFKYKTTVIIITHNPVFAKAGHRAIYLNNGRISKEVINEKVVNAKDLGWDNQ